MEKYYIVADTHIGGPHPKTVSALEIMELRDKHGDHAILVGDILDGSNCKKSRWESYSTIYDTLKLMYKDDYVIGNHCFCFPQSWPDKYYVIKNGIFFTHPLYKYSDDQLNKWRKKRGRSSMYRFLIGLKHKTVPLLGRESKLGKDSLSRALLDLEANNCHTFVCGHYHVSEVVDYTAEGKRIVILPRGLTEIEL